MTSTTLSESIPSAESAPTSMPTPSVASAAPVSASKQKTPRVEKAAPAAVATSKVLGYIIIIKSAKAGTLHAVMNPKAGPGVLATFEDLEQAVNAATDIPACKSNEYFLIPVGGE